MGVMVPGGGGLPRPSDPALAANAAASQPEGPEPDLGTDEPDPETVAAAARVMHSYPDARFAATHPR